MDTRWQRLAALAAVQYGAFCTDDMTLLGISKSMRSHAVRHGLLVKLGPRTLRFAATPPTWEQDLMAALLDGGTGSYVAGRSGAVLHGLDGFRRGPVELLVARHLRDRSIAGNSVSTLRPIPSTDVCRIDGLRTLRAERLILEAPLFGFSKEEIENAIDSAIRLRLVCEARLRRRIEQERSPGVNGTRALVDALVDTGGESALERAFLRLLASARLPRPQLQVRYGEGARTIARVDALFGDDLVVEVAGHRTHATRRQRQIDEQRRTELVLRAKRVITFTYDDVFDRPTWVADRVADALSGIVVRGTTFADGAVL